MSSVNRILTETMVRKALKEMKDSPKRSVRNLVDLALCFSKGRFQQRFFQAAQRMLEDERSPYYELLQDVITHVETERLMTFGMNVGYNSCTAGAESIRRIEAEEGFDIPWSLSLEIGEEFRGEQEDAYREVIRQGKELGIYTWMLFVERGAQNVLPLTAAHPECAFALFCPPEEVTEELLAEAATLYNLSVAVELGEGAAEACGMLRERGFLYAVLLRYDEQAVREIISGDLLCEAQALHPALAVLLPRAGTSAAAQQAVYAYVTRMRSEQAHQMLLWDLIQDGLMVDGVISEDTCSAGFDAEGRLRTLQGTDERERFNLFRNDLREIFARAFPKQRKARAQR